MNAALRAIISPKPAHTNPSWELMLGCAYIARDMTPIEGTAHATIAFEAYSNPDTPKRTPSHTNASAVIGWVSMTLHHS